MKLPAPLTDAQRQRVQSALGRLQSAHATFEAKLKAFAEATATRTTLDRQIDGARARLVVSAAEVDALKTQRGAFENLCQTRKGEMENARALAVDAIGCAGKVVREIAEPMSEQFKRGLAAALQPFCTDPAGAVAALPAHHTELPALQAFLSRGLHVSRTTTAGDLEFLKYDLCHTLQSILDGGHVWKLPREPFSSSSNSATHLTSLTSMKLPFALSAEQHAQVKNTVAQLESILTSLPGQGRKIDALQLEGAELDQEETSLRESGKHDRNTVGSLQAIGTQRGMIAEKIGALEAEQRAECRAAAAIVQSAAALVFGLLWGPLSSKLTTELVQAQVAMLKPFGVKPERAAHVWTFDQTPVCKALTAFVSHGRHIGFDTYNKRPVDVTPETILRFASEKKTVLLNILEGKDVFVFQP